MSNAVRDFIIDKFGTQENAAKVLGVSQAAVSNWVVRGYIPNKRLAAVGAVPQGTPISRQFSVEPAKLNIENMTISEAISLYKQLKEVFEGGAYIVKEQS